MRFGGGKIATDTDKSDGAYDPDKDRTMSSAYFIFDITNPESAPTLLAEITFPNLGYTTCYPAVIPMRDKQQTGNNFNANNWYLMLGSGPNGLESSGLDSDGDTVRDTYADNGALNDGTSKQPAVMYAVDLVKLATDGELWTLTDNGTGGTENQKYTTGTAAPFYIKRFSADTDSFISDPISVDWNADFNTDILYFGTVAGDETNGWSGKLRRIVVDNKLDPSGWELDSTLIDLTEEEIGAAVGNGQPIVAASSVGIDASDNRWVYFGTGRYYSTNDSYNTDQQTYYGIKEPYTTSADNKVFNWNAITRANLLDVSDATVYETSHVVQGVTNVDDYTGLIDAVDAKSGWLMDFSDPKERNIGQAVLFGDIVTFTSYIPSFDPCTIDGKTYLYALNYLTGTAYSESVIGRDSNEILDYNEKILKRLSLGIGFAVTPNIHTGREKGSKAFIQTSTGAIVTIEEDNPGIIKSGKVGWMEE